MYQSQYSGAKYQTRGAPSLNQSPNFYGEGFPSESYGT